MIASVVIAYFGWGLISAGVVVCFEFDNRRAGIGTYGRAMLAFCGGPSLFVLLSMEN